MASRQISLSQMHVSDSHSYGLRYKLRAFSSGEKGLYDVWLHQNTAAYVVLDLGLPHTVTELLLMGSEQYDWYVEMSWCQKSALDVTLLFVI